MNIDTNINVAAIAITISRVHGKGAITYVLERGGLLHRRPNGAPGRLKARQGALAWLKFGDEFSLCMFLEISTVLGAAAQLPTACACKIMHTCWFQLLLSHASLNVQNQYRPLGLPATMYGFLVLISLAV